jgi:adenosylcobinamide kinase/adenosylcobinamide-phosphate guanylyltransferase
VRILVLGGQASGKSRWAEDRARQAGLPVTYVATALAADAELAARIARHRDRRPPDWVTVEEPGRALELAAEVPSDRLVLLDGLGLALALYGADEARWWRDLERLAARPGPAVVVGELAGAGVVPADPAVRRFLDVLGRSAERLAAWAEEVVLVTAGLPLWLKGRAS